MLYHSFFGVTTDGTSSFEFEPSITVDKIEYMAIESPALLKDNDSYDDMASLEEAKREYWPFLE